MSAIQHYLRRAYDVNGQGPVPIQTEGGYTALNTSYTSGMAPVPGADLIRGIIAATSEIERLQTAVVNAQRILSGPTA
jgi:hypothetical protein